MNRINCFKKVVQLVLLLCFSAAQAGAYEDFFKAVAVDDATTVERLLQRGFDPNSRNEDGQPALLLCMRDGSERVAEVLLRSPTLEPDLANAAGETSLMMAALKGRTDWARRLAERGARIDREGWTPLHYAATGGPPELSRWLLDAGARIDARSPNGTTALMMASRYGSEATVDLLLQRGADARLHNDRQLDAAAFARLGGREPLAAMLAARAASAPQ